jgi:hypothetical protein
MSSSESLGLLVCSSGAAALDGVSRGGAGLKSSFARRRGVVEIEREVRGGDARHRIREGHWRDCRSNRRGNEAIGVWVARGDAVVNFSVVLDWAWRGASGGPMGVGGGLRAPCSAARLHSFLDKHSR